MIARDKDMVTRHGLNEAAARIADVAGVLFVEQKTCRPLTPSTPELAHG